MSNQKKKSKKKKNIYESGDLINYPKLNNLFLSSEEKNLNPKKLNSKRLFGIEELIRNETKSRNVKSEYQKKKDSRINEFCSLNKKCPYYKKYIELKKEFESIIYSNQKLYTFNQSLYKSLIRKTKTNKYLIEKNKSLQNTINDLLGSRPNETIVEEYKRRQTFKQNLSLTSLENNREVSQNNRPKSTLKLHYRNDYLPSKLVINRNLLSNQGLMSSNKINLLNLFEQKEPNFFGSSKLTQYSNKSKRINNVSKNIIFNEDYIPTKHYEIINSITENKNQKLARVNSLYSYISLNVDLIKVMHENENVSQLEVLTKNEDNFMKFFKNPNNDLLFKFWDLINSLINDYKEIIKLSMRMKDFIKGSLLLVDSIICNNSSEVFINNICNILKCDRASLFILDKISDSLIVYSGEGLKKAQIKIPKDKGVVGACFMESKKVRIDDAYLDKRFDKEIDLKTNYRTKSILCYPLIDKEGECFGVIEAINKFSSPFNNDDEELLNLLSHQASTIFKSVVYNDNNKFLIKKLYSIIEYSISIYDIKEKNKFTEKTEDTLLNLFNSMNSVFYFIENGKIVRYLKDRRTKEYNIDIGIIGKVIKSKEIIGYQDIKNSVDYNSIIDMNSSDGLLTFPILSKTTKIVCSVAQVPFIGEINNLGRPKENDIKLIKIFSKCIKNWIFRNKY